MIDWQSARACDKTHCQSQRNQSIRALYGPRCKVMGVSETFI